MSVKIIIPLIAQVINFFAPADSPHYVMKETTQEALDRYESIARDAEEVVFSQDEKPIFDGPSARVKTLAVMLAIDSYESGFRKDVDIGKTRGDSGNSVCLAQINLGGGTVSVKQDGTIEYGAKDGWTGKDLVTDRKKCFRVQLAVLRSSFACQNSDQNGKLMLYASGSCEKGYAASRNRMTRATKIIDQFLNITDEQAQKQSVSSEKED